MVNKNICILVLWTKVIIVLEELIWRCQLDAAVSLQQIEVRNGINQLINGQTHLAIGSFF